MDTEQFYEKVWLLRPWSIISDGGQDTIRDLMGRTPIVAVAAAALGGDWDGDDVIDELDCPDYDAAEALGLPPSFAAAIIDAADGFPSPEAKRLRSLTGRWPEATAVRMP